VAEVFVALGSNLGDREEHLRRALLSLRDEIAIERVSSIWLTEPVGLREQPAFYNAVLGGRAEQGARALLDAMLAIERSMGRLRDRSAAPMGPRTLDLDLLLYGDQQLREPGLVLPHPRMAQRRFVLAPLTEIAPELHIGADPRTVAERLADLPDEHGVERLDLPGWPPPLR
jgi:2-amino-4-hydroxy-6-hydroxymethyldihydropteridine diphosphokinase